MIVDFHSHILPCMDDGSESPEMSLAMLRAQQEQGVSRVILTPHFYRRSETAEAFLARRKAAMQALTAAIGNEPLPELLLGAEVAMTNELCRMSLKPLCIEGTKTLLLELPYAPMQNALMRDLQTLIRQNEVTIVLAHMERYDKLWGMKTWESVMALPCYKQLSCHALLHGGFWRKRRVIRWIQDERVHVLGTDAHNCTLRPVNMAQALQQMQQRGLSSESERMMTCAEKLTNPQSFQ